MHVARLIPIVVSALCLTSCANSEQSSGGSGGVPGAEVMNVTDCVVGDGVPNACTNLLPEKWWEADPATIETLVKAIPVTGNAASEIPRLAAEQCKKSNDKVDQATLTYDVPADMMKFPLAGTGGRHLVVALFSTNKEIGNCWEARYGVNKNNPKGSAVYFVTAVTVKTDKAGAVGADRVIGEWQSWAITRKNVSAPARLDSIARGAYVQCGKEHHTQYGNLAFIKCETATQIYAAVARDSGDASRAFNAILATARQNTAAGQAVRTQFMIDELTDPAWGRCGALGCCASY